MKELKKKIPTNAKKTKNFLVDAGLLIKGLVKKSKMDVRIQKHL